jgi:hypothetical protein
MQTYKITQISFDFFDEDLPRHLAHRLNKELKEEYLGSEWDVEDEENINITSLIENETGQCVEFIDYKLVRN